jgi:hypothetical protein
MIETAFVSAALLALLFLHDMSVGVRPRIPECSWIWFMDTLMRLRSLAAKAFLVLGLGMCLISFPEWRQHLPGPLLQRLERFSSGLVGCFASGLRLRIRQPVHLSL